MRKKNRQSTQEFKLEAIQLAAGNDKTLTRLCIFVSTLAILLLLPAFGSTQNATYPVDLMALSPDGTRLAVTGRVIEVDSEAFPQRFLIDIIDAHSGALFTSLEELDPVVAMCWDSSGGQLAAATSWGAVGVWQVAEGINTAVTGGGAVAINFVECSPAGDRFAFVVGRSINVGSFPDGSLDTSLVDHELHTNPGRFVWNSDGTLIASASSGPDILIWDVQTASITKRLEVVGSPRDSSQVDHMIANRTQNGILIFDIETGEELVAWPTDGSPEDISFSPNGSWLAATMNTEISVWNVSTTEVVATLTMPHRVRATFWSPDGTRLYHDGGPEGVYVNGVPLSSEDIPLLFAPPTASVDPDQSLTDDELTASAEVASEAPRVTEGTNEG